jgi:hypothetical protein
MGNLGETYRAGLLPGWELGDRNTDGTADLVHTDSDGVTLVVGHIGTTFVDLVQYLLLGRLKRLKGD